MELRVLPDIETQGDSGEKSPMWPHDRWHGRDCTRREGDLFRRSGLEARRSHRDEETRGRPDPALSPGIRLLGPSRSRPAAVSREESRLDVLESQLCPNRRATCLPCPARTGAQKPGSTSNPTGLAT